MSGLSFVADTNFLIAVHEGRDKVEPFLDGTVIISVISEVELLGWHAISASEKEELRALLDDCILFDFTTEVRKIAIGLRQHLKIKTPDAIIAATSKYLQIPLITSDKGFKAIPDLELIII